MPTEGLYAGLKHQGTQAYLTTQVGYQYSTFWL